MNFLLVSPIIIPLISAALLLVCFSHRLLQRFVGVLGAALLLAASILLLIQTSSGQILVTQAGGWIAPFGITLVADSLSAIMVLLSSLMGFSISIYSLGQIDKKREDFGFHPLFHILLMGINGAFLTGDIFNMYVWFEVMLMSSFVLVSLGGEKPQLRGAMKYVTLNLLSSALFLVGVGILYGMVGTLNMADLAQKLGHLENPKLITTVAVLFMVGFGIKAAIFPLFFWLPASYHTPPAAISAIFAGLLTKVGVYAMIRVFTLLFVRDIEFTHSVLIVTIAGFTMLTGVLGAVSQNGFRRILSFHIVSQIGYMILGLGLFTPLAIAGSIFYIIHHIIVKANLFLISGVVYRIRGSYQLKELGGIYEKYPWLGLLFLIPAFSLAGVPPLSGFFAKLPLVMSGLETGHYVVVAVALVVSLLTLYSMIKIWNEVFWKEAPSPVKGVSGASQGSLAFMIAPVVLLACLTVSIGIFAEPVFALADQAARQLLNPAGYINAVMGYGI